MIHAYKQVQRRTVETSVRELVTKHGDDWVYFAPMRFKREFTHDMIDASLMRMMERGDLPRVES